MKQIYLDNGATSFPKAPGVGQAMKDYIEKVGVNINRSSYRATAEAALSTLTVREDLCRLFGAGEDPSYAIFTSGVTMSLNMIMKGRCTPRSSYHQRDGAQRGGAPGHTAGGGWRGGFHCPVRWGRCAAAGGIREAYHP